jgi:hypothetical protein
MSLDDSAAEVLRLATVSPVAARESAARVLAAARAARAWAAVSVVQRALGVAAMQLNELDTAIAELRRAVASGRRAGSSRCAAEARMSLASALELRGRPTPAFRQINAALDDLDGLAAARALAQRSAMLQDLGRVDEALEDLRRALPALRRAGDAQWEASALSNRSLLYARRRAFADAEADLLAARELCARHELDLKGVYTEQNLGYLKAQRGDIPAALHHYGLAEQGYRRLGMEVGALLVDRAKLLLSVRLVREARGDAEAAVSAYERQQRRIHLPEAQLVLSMAALLEGDHGTALAAAERACGNLRRLGRREWLPLAQFARLQALVAADAGSVPPAQVRHVADRLHAAGWAVPAMEARILAGRLALERGQLRQARRDLQLAGGARFSGPADVRVRAWLAEGLLRRADGDRRRAAAALRAGLRVVEDYRATLGATELRTRVSAHRGELAAQGLRMALEDGNARAVLLWAERARATALLLPPARPPEDAVLARYLADLRSTVTELQQRGRDGGPASRALGQRRVSLERAIRDHCRKYPGAAAAPTTGLRSVEELAGQLGGTALVEYVELDEQLYAVSLVAGRARLHRLGPLSAVRRQMAHLPFALLRLVNPQTAAASRDAATGVLHRAGAVFDEVLLRPLGGGVVDCPVVVVPSAGLRSLPWSVLPSCAGRPVVVSPSASLWQRAAQRPAPVAGRTVVVAGPGLPGALAEATAVAALYPGCVRLSGDGATAANLSGAMDGAGLLHLAAHGFLRSDNPLFSALVMADGPFTVYDLERLRTAPHLVVLAACDTGRTHAVAGDEMLGFAAALLAGGTSTLIAPVMPVPDAETAGLMRSLHEHLRAGLTAPEALATAQAKMWTDDAAAGGSAAAFICLGAGRWAATAAASR